MTKETRETLRELSKWLKVALKRNEAHARLLAKGQEYGRAERALGLCEAYAFSAIHVDRLLKLTSKRSRQ